MFFSEEKNQKTFTSSPADRSRTWPESWEAGKNKRLLLVVFKSETSFQTPAAGGIAPQLCIAGLSNEKFIQYGVLG